MPQPLIFSAFGSWLWLTYPTVRNIYACELAKYLPNKPKNAVYRHLGVEIGEGSVIAPHAQIDPFFPDRITIGEDSVIGWDTKLLTHEAYADEWNVGPIESLS